MVAQQQPAHTEVRSHHRWIVLNFDAAYTIPGVDLLTVLFGQLQGVSIKLSLGLATYTSVWP